MVEMKYTITIELDKDRTTCLDCPLCDSNDNCQVQNLEYSDSWTEQLKTCPLEEEI